MNRCKHIVQWTIGGKQTVGHDKHAVLWVLLTQIDRLRYLKSRQIVEVWQNRNVGIAATVRRGTLLDTGIGDLHAGRSTSYKSCDSMAPFVLAAVHYPLQAKNIFGNMQLPRTV